MQERFQRLGRVDDRSECAAGDGSCRRGGACEQAAAPRRDCGLKRTGRVVVLLPGRPHELQAHVREAGGAAARAPRGWNATVPPRAAHRRARPNRKSSKRIAAIYTTYQGCTHDHPGVARRNSDSTCAHGRRMRRSAEHARRNGRTHHAGAGRANIYSTNGETLEEVVARDLTMNHATIATAESCTGGLLAERLTRIPRKLGRIFLGGVVCYSESFEIALGGCAGGHDRIERRGEPGGCAGAG